MKRYLRLILAFTSIFSAAPMVMAQHSDHVEVGAFADYFRFGDADPARNFLGLGGRAAVNLRPSIQLEAEMAYDFKWNFSRTFTDGFTTELVTRTSERCTDSSVRSSRPDQVRSAYS